VQSGARGAKIRKGLIIPMNYSQDQESTHDTAPDITNLDEPTQLVCDMLTRIEVEKHGGASERSICARVRDKAIDILDEAMGEAGRCHHPMPNSGMSIADHKAYKGIPPEEDLYDHMTILELTLTNLYQCLILQLMKERNSYGSKELLRDCIDAGRIAGRVRELVERETGYTILSDSNNL
jgi:hypothetical protein